MLHRSFPFVDINFFFSWLHRSQGTNLSFIYYKQEAPWSMFLLMETLKSVTQEALPKIRGHRMTGVTAI